jgi:hypothetical protein
MGFRVLAPLWEMRLLFHGLWPPCHKAIMCSLISSYFWLGSDPTGMPRVGANAFGRSHPSGRSDHSIIRSVGRSNATDPPPALYEPLPAIAVFQDLQYDSLHPIGCRRYSRWLCAVQIFIDIPDIPVHPILQRNWRSKMRQPCRHRCGQEGAVGVRGE